jgi:thioredoxin-related protein
MHGNSMSEKDYAEAQKTNFTPSLVFYNRDGIETLMLRGYYPPYRFRAALEYVADNHYQRMSFPEFLSIAPTTLAFEKGDLIEESFFEPPPYALDRSHFPSDQPLLVMFEQGDCYACDVLHSGPLQDPGIREQLKHFQTVQLNLTGNTPVITPAGERTTDGKWAQQLGLFYTPSLLFFDEHGKEIIRVDSVVRFSRLSNVLEYVATKAYQDYPTFQRWRQSHSTSSNEPTGGSGSSSH